MAQTEQRDGHRVVVKAKGAQEYFFFIDNPVYFPRVGEFVKFDDGLGVVERVTWDVKAEPLVTITVECVPHTG